MHKFGHLHNNNVHIILLGQDGTNPSIFEDMFNWWRKIWKNTITVNKSQSVWVCLKGGVGQTSEAARISGLSFYAIAFNSLNLRKIHLQIVMVSHQIIVVHFWALTIFGTEPKNRL